MTNWIKNLEPTICPDKIGLIQLAWLGDSVWELHQRLNHIHLPVKSKFLHLSVVKEVHAEAQAESLKFIQPFLNSSERDLVRRARNKTKKCPKSVNPAIYAKSTGFETLIGWLFLKDPKRLRELLNELETK